MKTILLTTALLVTSTGFALSFPIAQHSKEGFSSELIIKIQAFGCDAKKKESQGRAQEIKDMEKFLDERSRAGKNTSGVKNQITNAEEELEALEIKIKKFC